MSTSNNNSKGAGGKNVGGGGVFDAMLSASGETDDNDEVARLRRK